VPGAIAVVLAAREVPMPPSCALPEDGARARTRCPRAAYGHGSGFRSGCEINRDTPEGVFIALRA
jgi:hypothetical protein